MPGRKFTQVNSTYRYGFNGQEKSNEIDPADNLTTAEYWEYDSRLGRRWNIDPKPTYGVSVYAAFLNNPILVSDVKGDSGTLPRNPYSGKLIVDPLTSHPFYTNSFPSRPANAPVDRNTTYGTDVAYIWSGGDALFTGHAPMSTLGSYTSNPGFSPLNMKATPSGQQWNEYTDSKNYFNFTGRASETGIVNLLLGNYIKGTGPQNYIFPVNGSVSKSLVDSRILGDAFSAWRKGGSKDNFEKKIEFSGNRQLELISQGKIISLENFVGSANVTINRITANEIIVRIYNVTSITSGDISKHFPGGIWMPSVVADPNNGGAQPYSNILQIYQLSFTGYKMKNGYTDWITNSNR